MKGRAKNHAMAAQTLHLKSSWVSGGARPLRIGSPPIPPPSRANPQAKEQREEWDAVDECWPCWASPYTSICVCVTLFFVLVLLADASSHGRMQTGWRRVYYYYHRAEPPSPPPPPLPPWPFPPPPPPPDGTTSGAVASAATAATAAWFWAVDGNPELDSSSLGVRQVCASSGDVGRTDAECRSGASASAGVRCCGDEPRSSCCRDFQCASPPCNCTGSGEGYQRCLRVTQAESAARCTALGLRLCSAEEVMRGQVAGLGCYLDFERVWTSSPCQPTLSQLLLSHKRDEGGGGLACLDTCPLARNGRCEDGGQGAHRGVEVGDAVNFEACASRNNGFCCEMGADCSDCGPRVVT